jgi:hypothetical protein
MRWFFVLNNILNYKMNRKIMGLMGGDTPKLPTIFQAFSTFPLSRFNALP